MARKGSIPVSMSTNNRLLREKSDQRRLRLHESENVSRLSDGVIPRFPTLLDYLFTAWCRALVVLIFAKMSRYALRSEVSRSTNIPRRLRQRLLVVELREGYSGRRLQHRQVFYRRSGEDAVNDHIVRLIVDFAHTLGLKVTAEGVENDQQVDSLRVMRCDLAQGFYFSKPLGGEAAGKFIATNPAWGCLYKRSP